MKTPEAKVHTYATALTSKQKAFFKGKAHSLKPIVQIGASGLTDQVLAEIEKALKIHELIKVQSPGDNSAQDKKDFLETLQSKLAPNTHIVSRMGRTLILYLEKPPKKARFTLDPLKDRGEV